MEQVYFAECNGAIKIGFTATLAKRITHLQTASAFPVTLIDAVAGDRATEQALHRKLDAFRLEGEWFKDCPEVRAAIQNSLNNFPAIPAGQRATRKRRKFADVAKVLWPKKPAAHLAGIAGVNMRTAERWLSGECEPPAVVIAATICEMVREQ